MKKFPYTKIIIAIVLLLLVCFVVFGGVVVALLDPRDSVYSTKVDSARLRSPGYSRDQGLFASPPASMYPPGREQK